MSKPYSEDLREHRVAAVEGGLSRRQAAEVFEVRDQLGDPLGSALPSDRQRRRQADGRRPPLPTDGGANLDSMRAPRKRPIC